MNQWLYQILISWLNSLSNRELECLDYDRFSKYAGITSEESNEYFKFLRENKLIIEKQVSLCPQCKAECVIDTSFYEEEFQCEECEQSFQIVNLKRHSTILYKISNDFFRSVELKVKSQFSNENNVIQISKIRGENQKKIYIEPEEDMKLKVFLSYSHEDEIMKQELDKALIMLKRNKKIDTWNDRYLTVGSQLEKEILENLKTADIILLLISTDFLASQYCFEKEMQIAIDRHKNGEAIVIPVILRKCDWLNSELKDLVATPKDGKPIKSWDDKDEAYYEVKEEIEKVVDKYMK